MNIFEISRKTFIYIFFHITCVFLYKSAGIMFNSAKQNLWTTKCAGGLNATVTTRIKHVRTPSLKPCLSRQICLWLPLSFKFFICIIGLYYYFFYYMLRIIYLWTLKNGVHLLFYITIIFSSNLCLD